MLEASAQNFAKILNAHRASSASRATHVSLSVRFAGLVMIARSGPKENFEAAITEFGIEGAMAHAWLNSTMIGIESLVSEIEAGGGAAGGNA